MANLLTELPGYGTIGYGDYVFNNTTETSVDVSLVTAPDGRSVSHAVYQFEFRTRVGAAEMTALMTSLQTEGLPFRYRGRGLDLFTGGVLEGDVLWGPRPKVLNVRPLGGIDGANEVRWRVEVALPRCLRGRLDGPMSLAVRVEFAVDYAGRTARTWSGQLKIVNNYRADGQGAYDSPDLYREAVTPPPLPGFYREWGPWVTSEDRTTLSFSVTDRELPGWNVPPEWVVGTPVLSHQVKSSDKGLTKFFESFSGEYELSKDAPDTNWPAEHFFGVFVASRISALRTGLGPNTGKGGPKTIIPLSIAWSEPNALGPPKFEFSCSFFFVCDQPGQVIPISGTWMPLPGSSWPAWAKSLQNSAFSPWGTAGVYFDVEDDQVVSLCEPLPPDVSAGESDTDLTAGEGDLFDLSAWVASLVNGIGPDTSWVDYQNDLVVVPESGAVMLRTLPSSPPPATDGGTNGGVMGALAGLAYGIINGVGGGLPAAAGGLPDPAASAARQGYNVVVQRRVTDTARVVMQGYALRAVYTIPQPTLDDVGGVKPVPFWDKDNDYWTHNVVYNAGGAVIYGASWHFTYLLDQLPQNPVGPAPNPLLTPDGGAGSTGGGS